jgi:citrate synthase
MHLPTLGHGFDWCADHLEWPVMTDVGAGFAGVIAGTTRVMWLDPASGRLAYRGVPIDDLAAEPDFEQAAFLLITGATAAADPPAFDRFRANLRDSRRLPPDVAALTTELAAAAHPTRVLRAGVSALGCHELDVDDDLGGGRHWQELRIVGQVAALAGAIIERRRSRSNRRVSADESLSESVLHALTGRPPTDDERQVLDLLWVLYAAHGLDAPTFASMVIASCLADPYYTVVGGLSALRGPRQGGAGERVLDALLALGGPEEARRWARRTIEAGDTIPGFGHSSYRMPDPRVVLLRKTSATLAARQGRTHLFEIARAIEAEASRGLAPKGVFVNVNLYGALLFHLLGAQPAEVPCLISVARVSGIVALVRECLDSVRLFRPLTRYVGPTPRRVPARGRP